MCSGWRATTYRRRRSCARWLSPGSCFPRPARLSWSLWRYWNYCLEIVAIHYWKCTIYVMYPYKKSILHRWQCQWTTFSIIMTLTMRWGVHWHTYENQQTVVDFEVLIRWGVCWSRSTPRMIWRYLRSFSFRTFLIVHFSRLVHFWEHCSQVLAGYLKWLNAAPEPDDEVF